MLNHINFIDTHIHLWDLNNDYPWIQNNENHDLKQNYLIENLMNDAKGLSLKKIVHIQAEISEKNKIKETEWLQKISDSHPLSFPNAIVGFVNLLDSKAEKDLEEHKQFKNFRGIRQILKCKDRKNDFLYNELWLQNFNLLKKFDLSFDILIYYTQYKQAIDLIKKFPSVQFLINHCLWPEESLDDFDGWKKAVNEMSKLDNVVLKISGFGEWKTNWSTDFISDYIKVAIDSFGTKRCMFASNFPVDKFFSKSTYQSFWLAYMKIISKFSHTEINDLLMKNAEKYYRI